MSIFSLPRLHFTGTASARLATGPRGGRLDLATCTAVTDADADQDENFGANGHFSVDATISRVELTPGEISAEDPLVGTAVDMWGHYNPYLQTTANRARVFDLDPSSHWTTTLMVGQFGFGRRGRSHDSGYALTGSVQGFQPPRWHDPRGGSVVHQFVVTADDLALLDPSAPAVRALAAADGLLVQFALVGRTGVRGTIAPWYRGEPRTCPAGRLLVPACHSPLANVTVDLTAEHVTLNMITTDPGPLAGPAPLELWTVSGKPVAVVPPAAWRADAGGIVRVPRAAQAPDDEPLVLLQGCFVLLREKEITFHVDDACQVLEHPRHPADAEHDVRVDFRSFVRGRPAAISRVWLKQFVNPAALPRRTIPTPDDARIVRILPSDVVSTDECGRGSFVLRGAEAGSTRVLLTADPLDEPPAESAAQAYDNDDELGFWSGASSISVRVLPDDWWLADLAPHEVTFELVHREVFAYYEQLYPFMKNEVFSLADRCKVDTYAKLIWQMCDPRNKHATYYMPPTRDLTEPKARLLLEYLRAQQKPDEVLRVLPPTGRTGRGVGTRAELVTALRHAVTLELAVMAQYLYAAYSVPTHGAGLEHVRRGEWTRDQLRIACGDGGETRDEGVRGTLVTVAREEMIHFLMANNILMAIGEPFHVPRLDFATINSELPVPLDFSLERLDFGSIQRFIRIEEPHALTGDVRLGDRTGQADHTGHTYSSLSELYEDIRQGLQEVPGLFLTEPGRGGGEHHLFLRESINTKHPDYQLEVDDLPSALFAVDVITEQGEGAQHQDEDSHHQAFRKVARILRDADWVPSYPVLRNPSVRQGNPAAEHVTDPEARQVVRLFNDAYFVMLQLMVQHFGAAPDSSLRRSRLMNSAIDVMTGVLRPLGELLVTMPSGRRGRTAGPSFELDETPGFLSRPDVAMRSVAMRLDDIAAQAGKCPLVPVRVAELSSLIAHQLLVRH